jgi:hypothetical protein
MGIQVSDLPSVSGKLKRFGLNLPEGLVIVPSNLAEAKSIEDLRQQVEGDTVRTILRKHNIDLAEIFDDNNQPPYIQQYSFEWFGPTILISASFIIQNPNTLSVVLGLITNYLYDLFKGSKNGAASFNLIYQRSDGSCKEIRYSGPPDGLNKIHDIIKEIETDRK